MAGIGDARLVVVATSDPHETRLIVERARALNPGSTSSCGPTATARPPTCARSAARSRPSTASASWRSRWPATRCAGSGSVPTEAEAIAQGLRGRAAAVAGQTGSARGGTSDVVARLRRGLESATDQRHAGDARVVRVVGVSWMTLPLRSRTVRDDGDLEPVATGYSMRLADAGSQAGRVLDGVARRSELRRCPVAKDDLPAGRHAVHLELARSRCRRSGSRIPRMRSG